MLSLLFVFSVEEEAYEEIEEEAPKDEAEIQVGAWNFNEMGFSPDTFRLLCLNDWRMMESFIWFCLLVLVLATDFETCSIKCVELHLTCILVKWMIRLDLKVYALWPMLNLLFCSACANFK